MTLESLAVDPLASPARRRHVDRGPGWLAKWRLRSLNGEIARLERLMDDEFGTTAIAPLLREHAELTRQRDALQPHG